jgi:predicted ABC-type ATPase
LADTWEVYDNSGFEPFLIAFGGRDEPTTILETEQWQRIKGQAV